MLRIVTRAGAAPLRTGEPAPTCLTGPCFSYQSIPRTAYRFVISRSRLFNRRSEYVKSTLTNSGALRPCERVQLRPLREDFLFSFLRNRKGRDLMRASPQLPCLCLFKLSWFYCRMKAVKKTTSLENAKREGNSECIERTIDNYAFRYKAEIFCGGRGKIWQKRVQNINNIFLKSIRERGFWSNITREIIFGPKN